MCTGRPTAPIITRYRCFLPDLAGLAGLRRVGPGTGTILPLLRTTNNCGYSFCIVDPNSIIQFSLVDH